MLGDQVALWHHPVKPAGRRTKILAYLYLITLAFSVFAFLFYRAIYMSHSRAASEVSNLVLGTVVN